MSVSGDELPTLDFDSQFEFTTPTTIERLVPSTCNMRPGVNIPKCTLDSGATYCLIIGKPESWPMFESTDHTTITQADGSTRNALVGHMPYEFKMDDGTYRTLSLSTLLLHADDVGEWKWNKLRDDKSALAWNCCTNNSSFEYDSSTPDGEASSRKHKCVATSTGTYQSKAASTTLISPHAIGKNYDSYVASIDLQSMSIVFCDGKSVTARFRNGLYRFDEVRVGKKEHLFNNDVSSFGHIYLFVLVAGLSPTVLATIVSYGGTKQFTHATWVCTVCSAIALKSIQVPGKSHTCEPTNMVTDSVKSALFVLSNMVFANAITERSALWTEKQRAFSLFLVTILTLSATLCATLSTHDSDMYAPAVVSFLSFFLMAHFQLKQVQSENGPDQENRRSTTKKKFLDFARRLIKLRTTTSAGPSRHADTKKIRIVIGVLICSLLFGVPVMTAFFKHSKVPLHSATLATLCALMVIALLACRSFDLRSSPRSYSTQVDVGDG